MAHVRIPSEKKPRELTEPKADPIPVPDPEADALALSSKLLSLPALFSIGPEICSFGRSGSSVGVLLRERKLKMCE